MHKHCLGVLFSHTDPTCVGDRASGKPSCGFAAQCASSCDSSPHIEGEVPSWEDLNQACVSVDRRLVKTYELSRIELRVPSLQEGI